MFFLENIGEIFFFQIVFKIKQLPESCFGNLRHCRILLVMLNSLESLSEMTICTRPMPTKMERQAEWNAFGPPGSCICLQNKTFHITDHPQHKVVAHSWLMNAGLQFLANRVLSQTTSYLNSLWVIKNVMQHVLQMLIVTWLSMTREHKTQMVLICFIFIQ